MSKAPKSPGRAKVVCRSQVCDAEYRQHTTTKIAFELGKRFEKPAAAGFFGTRLSWREQKLRRGPFPKK